ncbi:mechanosensitive ion channel family protein [Rhizobium bangladeshense]|uniref:mechanosensitive ion channel family protein n=1 Tax=Rhizobium bangladeshense TaxID=1138189 RepID=UPI001C82A6B3|nr:mechanosensitive ion channel family protein [Rhizobium bangladeshense]MBX4900793.1 mechanosensitive ion channel family protein [Rhizobium bangladeshense]MBX4913000.1 mechanosensitive ion channel family protein [Rhizobium bangladeshense]
MVVLSRIRTIVPFSAGAALASLLLCASIAMAQSPTPVDPQPESVQRFIAMFSDPDVQRFLQQQSQAARHVPEPPLEVPNRDPSFSEFTMRFRAHASALLGAVNSFPLEATRAWAIVEADIRANGGTRPILLIAAFVAAGLAAQWLFWWVSVGWRRWMSRASYGTISGRVVALAARFLWAGCYVLSFGLGSIGFFLLFQWPPVIREIVVGYLLATVIFRLGSALFEVFLTPRAEEEGGFRVVPLARDAACHWAKRLAYLVGWYAFGWVTIRLLDTLGFSLPARQLAAYCLGLVLLLIVIEAVWRRPSRSPSSQTSRIGVRARNWLWTSYFFAAWLLWVVGAMRLFWIAVIGAALPAAIALTKASVDNILRSPATEEDGHKRSTVVSVVVERGIRAALIVAAIVLLAQALDVRLTEMTMQDSPLLRLVRGLLSAGIILMIVDLTWNLVAVLIDRKLGDTEAVLEAGSDRERRRLRIRTLLPILRNFLMILFVAIAIMMALSSLGIEIGPLIAGAGVVGVAIGFGAQTVVKDVISGVFYLLDDAFRVGEYIQSGSYKGTVESFSLRSVKLRHHRGAVFIVPFSELGAIQNMSRDWVIEKMTITVTYDSDIEKARKIIKKIGLELFEDPEFKATTIEPLKMQGIDSLGDSGLLLRMKVMTLPGQQFTLKRRALRMIHEAFHENGIKLAVPTVQVSGGNGDAVGAAAQQTIAAHNVAIAAGPA